MSIYLITFCIGLAIILSVYATYNIRSLWVSIKETREHNKKLFKRSWKVQLFLMDIYPDCPPDVQLRVDKFLSNIEAL
jgi:hypothetical protein